MTQTKAELLQTRHQGDIRLGDADSSHYVGFKAPATVSSSLVWILPAADGSSNQFLKTDGSGNLSWATDSATDSTKMPLAGGTFTGDVFFQDTAQLEITTSSTSAYALRLTDAGVANYDFVFPDTSTIKITTNTGSTKQLELRNAGSGHFDFLLADNGKLKLGDSNDLQIHHDGSHNRIDSTNGNIYLRHGTDNAIKTVPNGTVELYYDDSLRFQTDSNGCTVHSTRLQFMDNTKAQFGTGGDLQIYFDGTNSYIAEPSAQAGQLILQGWNGTDIRQGSTGEHMIRAIGGGAVELYHNNVKKIETTAQAVKITGGIAQVVTAAGALELDLNTSNYFTKTISGNSTFTFANPAASGQVTAFTLELTHSSGTVTWPSSVKWNADTAPTLTTGKTHLFMFVTDDGGSRYRGSALVDYVN